MGIIERLQATQDEAVAWRRDIHAHPETAFEELRTSTLISDKLESFGIEVHRGLAKTGLVGRLTAGGGNRAIGLRADMDALPIAEKNEFEHRSRHEGRMHACGHDGHVAMLLAAARHLAETRAFCGTVYFIFQPAEEHEGGGRLMVEEGLFDKFPVESVYGMHNMPGMDSGTFSIRAGPVMAARDTFEITVKGRGHHAAMPHQGVDPVIVAAQIVGVLQTIVSRSTDPLDALVVSVTQIHSGNSWNAVPDDAVLRGTTRSLRSEVQHGLESAIRRAAEGVAAAHGASINLHYEYGYPPTVNSAAEAELAAAAAVATVGASNVKRHLNPAMGAEDFAFMLQKRPGCYVWIGNGVGDGSCLLHNSHYDFNDGILAVGASYWVNLVQSILAD
jgi:hippurate hydrolase